MYNYLPVLHHEVCVFSEVSLLKQQRHTYNIKGGQVTKIFSGIHGFYTYCHPFSCKVQLAIAELVVTV